MRRVPLGKGLLPFFLAAAGLLALVAVPRWTREASLSRPNILVLFSDDQRADTIADWGNPHIKTPNLDRLVQTGFSFRSNYNLGGDIGAICAPSRAMLNSGRAYFRITHDLAGTPTLPELLRKNGYVTFATGKWHNEKASWLRSFERGKNVFFGGMANHTKVPVTDLSPNGELVNERTRGKFSSELFADAAVEFLKGYRQEKPFYVYVAFTAPHDPRQPPEEFRNSYYRSPPPPPANFLPQHPFSLGHFLTVRDEQLAPWPRTQDVISSQLAEYYGLITHLDTQIGRILTALEASGHAKDTLIIFASDQGLALGSHGLMGKQSLYEHSQKCPLIFSGPGVPHGQSAALTYLLDIFPTVGTLARVSLPPDLDGFDLSPIWKGEKQEVRDSLFLAFADVIRSVRDRRYKLLRYPRIDYTQLFDLRQDPYEMHNLAGQGEQAHRVEDMTALLRQWQTKLGDTQPLSIEHPEPKEVDLTGTPRKPDLWQPRWIVDKYF